MNERTGPSSMIERIKKAVRDVPDFPKKGIVFKDITPVLGDPALMKGLIELLAAAVEGPEETAAYQQRLRLVAGCIESMEVARLKFIDDLPDKEIAARCNLTRDGVAGQLKRLRKRLREVLAAADRITEGAPK